MDHNIVLANCTHITASTCCTVSRNELQAHNVHQHCSNLAEHCISQSAGCGLWHVHSIRNINLL